MRNIKTLTAGEIEVKNYLESFKFKVAKIDEVSTHQSPDFLVEDENSQYIIEVKDKENQKFINLINSQTRSDKIDLEYDNAISSIVREGAKQLDSYKKKGKIFKVLWFFVNVNLFGGAISTQIRKTLYGLQEIEGYKKSGEYFHGICFYFTFSEFYRNKLLDAVIVQSPAETVLCMNDLSTQRDELRKTKLYQLFVEKKLQIIEPSNRGYYIADDFSLDRKNRKAVAEYIGNKYNLREIKVYTHFLFNLPLD